MRSSKKPHRSSWRLFYLLIFLILINLNESTVVCDDCRPMSLQEGPGVGISLSPGHGTVAVQFVNGTFLNIGTIEATEAYIEAMRLWDDFLIAGRVLVRPTSVHSSTPADWRTISHQSINATRPRKPDKPRRWTPPSLEPLSEMVQALWKKAIAATPLEHKKVHLSLPDFITDHNIEHIIKQAGLEYHRRSFSCKNSLWALYNIEDCWDDDGEEALLECETYRGTLVRSVLSIHIDDRSMTLQAMVRDDGMFQYDSESAQLVWRTNETDLESEIRRYSNIDFDHLSLSGPSAPQIYDMIKHIFRNSTKIHEDDFVRSVEEHTYAPARGAARLARFGMCNDNAECIPRWPWCEISKYCRQYFYLPPLEEKDEL